MAHILPNDIIMRIIKEADGGRYATKQKMDKVVSHVNKAVQESKDVHERRRVKSFAQAEESAANFREMAAEGPQHPQVLVAKMISLAEETMADAVIKRNADDFEFYRFFTDYHNWDNAKYARGEIWSTPTPAWLEALPSHLEAEHDGSRPPMGCIWSDGEFIAGTD